MSWYADGSVTFGGFTICGSATAAALPPPPPPALSPPPPSPSPPPPVVSPAPPTPSGWFWRVVRGSTYCQVTNNGACVTDGVGNHGNNERCEVVATRALYATAAFFSTETYFDYITIGSTRWSGSTGPSNVRMAAGATMSWFADGSVIYAGFTICATTTPALLPPMSYPPPPSPSPPPPTASPPASPRAPGLCVDDCSWASDNEYAQHSSTRTLRRLAWSPNAPLTCLSASSL